MRVQAVPHIFIFRGIVLGMLWWLLTGGALHTWAIGSLTVFLGLYVTSRLPPIQSFRISFKGALFFLFFFLKQSFLAGVDVAKIAFHPKSLLDPCLISYQPRLTSETALVFFVNTISLLPGTLSVHLEEQRLLVHILDKNKPVQDDLKSLEDKIGNLFCENKE